MRTTASIVLCLLLTSLFLPMMSVSANLIDAGQTEQISEKVVAWEQMSDGKIMMVTGSGILSINTFEAGVHSEDWSLDLNVSANSATIDSGENLVAVAHSSGVVIVQMVQQIITEYINTSDPVDTVDSSVSFDEIARTTFDVGSEFSTTVNVSEEPSSPTFVDPPDSITVKPAVSLSVVVTETAWSDTASKSSSELPSTTERVTVET